MKNISLWQDTSSEIPPFAPLSGNHKADVVIIGGGISGLTAAHLLSKSGLKTILLEALRIGGGTTGNSTGNLYVSVDEYLHKIRKKWSTDVMKQVVASRFEAMGLIKSIIAEYNLQCDFQEVPFHLVCEEADKNILSTLDEEIKAFEEAKLNPYFTENVSAPFKAAKMLSIPRQAQFHPLNYARQLAAALSSKCAIHEHSAVTDFDADKGIVRTNTATVETQHIVMATHVPKGVWMVQTVLGPYREHAFAANLTVGTLQPGIYWNLGKVKHSVRPFSANGKNYAMVIGDKYKTGQGGDTSHYVRGLQSYLNERFITGTETYTWAGQQYRPADSLPYIGKSGERLYMLTGFATDGLVYGTLGAMVVTDQIKGVKNSWEETYKYKRLTPVKSFREFFRENIDNMGEYLKDAPWNADAKETSEIRPGEGKVIEHGGEKLAVYRDTHGKLKCVSAVCTHMKCTVNWNPEESTWDCPCHGSRFNVDGSVIEGPAVVALPAKEISKQNK